MEALERWRAAFAEELSAWDIDPPLHHVKASHDEIADLLAASPTPPQAVAAKPETERKYVIKDCMHYGQLAFAANRRGEADALYSAAALLSADSKDAGEPVAWTYSYALLRLKESGGAEFSLPVSTRGGDVPLYLRPQAAELAALKADIAEHVRNTAEQATEIEALETAAISVIASLYLAHEDCGAELGGKVAAQRMLMAAMQTKEAS